MESQNEQIRQRYNKVAKEYKDNPVAQSLYFRDGVPANEAIFDAWVPYIQKYFKIGPNDHLLDVGCGSGLFLKRFKTYTQHLYGVDPAEEVIKSTRLRCPEAKCNVGDVFNTGFEGIKFNKLFCNSVILYLDIKDECERAIRHFFDITTDDAKIWIGDNCMPNPALNDKDYKRIETSTGWKVQHYPPQFFYRICDSMGYKCRVLYQEVPKDSAAYRYDLLIEKK